DLPENIGIQIFGKTYDIEGNLRFADHCVYITQSIRRRHLSECIRIIHYRSEKVQRLNRRHVICNLIDRRIVRSLESYEQIRVAELRKPPENPGQCIRSDLRRASPLLCKLCQMYFLYH